MCSRSSGFGIGYSIGRKYQPIWVSVLVLDRNQNSGFCRSLVDPVISTGRGIMNLVLNVCFDFFQLTQKSDLKLVKITENYLF